MLTALESFVRQWRHKLRKWALNPSIHSAARLFVHFAAGFILSAASLGNVALPLAMGFVCACTGWSSVVAALGGGIGYLFFWSIAGLQGLLWLAAALATTLLIGTQRSQTPFLLCAIAGFIVSAGGVLFQVWAQDMTPVSLYLLRIALGAGSTELFSRVIRGRNPILEWLAGALCVLAMAQISFLPGFSLGYLAAGILSASGAFPAVALAGVALDLAQLTPVSMTASLSIGYLVRFLPRYPKWLSTAAPCFVYLSVMTLCGYWDFSPLPALLIGCILGNFLPAPAKLPHRRGETGAAQVRLEMAANVLAQTERLLLEAPVVPVDEDALVSRAAERACSSCPCRKNCKDSRRLGNLPGLLLHKPLLNTEEIPIVCRKSGRFLAELHRSQEQLRSIRADRERQQEYRAAIIQQYRFLVEYLQDLSDQLARHIVDKKAFYTPKIQVFGNRPEPDNGDRCVAFSGTELKYYVLLCDGMGTGLGAVQEGRTATQILRRLLSAGYPAEYALRSLNSLCALRDRAGAVTVDLVELLLDSGKGTLYKWGAAPSYMVSELGAEKIGVTGPPPGLSVADYRETCEQLSLRRKEMLILVSDGIGEADALRCCTQMTDKPANELADALLTCAEQSGEDDATVVAILLQPYNG